MARHIDGPQHHQPPQAVIALATDMTDAGFLGTAVGQRRQPRPGGEVSPGAEAFRIADRGDHRVRSERAHAGDLHQPAHTFITVGSRDEARLELVDARLQGAPLLDQRLQRGQRRPRNDGIASPRSCRPAS